MNAPTKKQLNTRKGILIGASIPAAFVVYHIVKAKNKDGRMGALVLGSFLIMGGAALGGAFGNAAKTTESA